MDAASFLVEAEGATITDELSYSNPPSKMDSSNWPVIDSIA